VRLGAVHELRNLLASSNKGLMLASQAALTALATGDDSQEVRTAAQQYWAAPAAGAGVGTNDPGAVGRERAERERLSAEEAERQRIAKAEAERAAQDLQRAKVEAERQRAELAEAERAGRAAGEQQIAAEAAAYAAACHRGRLEDWKAFLAQFPVGPHRDEALLKISALTYVHPMRRAAADLVDWLVTLGVFVSIVQLKSPELVGLLAIGAPFVCAIYIRKAGATPGHKLMDTRIVDFRGNPLTYPRSIAYVILWLICFPTLIWGTALCVRFSLRHVAIYDLLAGTKAVARKA
jgi:uncharacterized RDD family membrane protein YckC